MLGFDAPRSAVSFSLIRLPLPKSPTDLRLHLQKRFCKGLSPSFLADIRT